MRRLMAVLAVLGLLVAACSSDPTGSEEYQELEQKLADTEQALAEVTAERDALAATASGVSERHDKALANQEAVEDILHNPETYGSEEEVVELLATYATEDAVMDDAVFGAAPILTAWRETLHGGAMDAEIENYYRWLSEDGSQGGVLWIWRGTNLAGNPFELAGISLNEYDENGLLTYSYVVYPYPDDYVNEAIVGEGTAQSAEEVSSDDMFVFGEDDLCEWVTEDEVTTFVRNAYEEVGEYECQWTLTGSDGEITAYSEVAGQTEEVVSYEELDTTWVEIGANVNGHPDFDAEVVINNQGFGQYAFLIPTSEDQLVLSVYLPIEDDSVDYEKPLFIVANGFLEEMNWTS
jgi:hypothetical protein